jgi:hypothetical protein
MERIGTQNLAGGMDNLLKLLARQPLAKHVELVEAAIFEGYRSAAAGTLVRDSHFKTQKIAEMLFYRPNISIISRSAGDAWFRGLAFSNAGPADQRFGLAD